MPDANRGVSPDTVVDTIPGDGGKPSPSSLPTQEANPEFAAQVERAKSPKEVLELLETLKKAPAAKKPVEAPEPKPDNADQPAETSKTGAENPPTDTTEEPGKEKAEEPDAPTEPDPDAEPEKPDADDDSVTPLSAAKARLRIPENDKTGRLAAAYMQRNKDWSMEQALEAARKQLGIKPEASETTAPTPAATKKSDLPETIEGVDAALDALLTEKSKAVKELRFEDTDDLDRKIRQLDRQRLVLERKGEQQVIEKVKIYEKDFTASEKRAVEFYPFAADPESEGGKRMVEIEKLLEETNDPIFRDPNKPMIIAQMVARELKVAPKAKAATPAKTVVKPLQTVPAKPKQILPTGGSQTATPQNPSVELNAKIQSARNPHELKQVLKTVGIRLPNA